MVLISPLALIHPTSITVISQLPSFHRLAHHASSGEFSDLMTPLELHLQNALLRVVFNVCDCGFLHGDDLQVLWDAWREISENIIPSGSSGSMIQDINPNSNGRNPKSEGDTKH